MCHVALPGPQPATTQEDTIPRAVNLSLTLLKMGKSSPKHVELILEINKLLLLHLVGSFYIILPTLDTLDRYHLITFICLPKNTKFLHSFGCGPFVITCNIFTFGFYTIQHIVRLRSQSVETWACCTQVLFVKYFIVLDNGL